MPPWWAAGGGATRGAASWDPRSHPRGPAGLRREEVAQLAGLSVDCLARLEQGRATHPSASVLGPLARAPRLSDEERAHLFRVAGHSEPDGDAALGRFPEDRPLRALIDDLRAGVPRFAALWDRRPVARHGASRKTFRHPEVGEITVDCDALQVGGSDLRLIVHTAEPGSADAQSLALLGAVGLQSFA